MKQITDLFKRLSFFEGIYLFHRQKCDLLTFHAFTGIKVST